MRRILLVTLVILLACTTAILGSGRRTSLPAPTDLDVETPPEDEDVVTIDQGIWGYVRFWDGDFIPPLPHEGTITGVSREMHIYELTSADDVEPAGYDCFYSTVYTPLVAVVQSADNGFFEIALEPGDYSVFSLEEDGLLYANQFYGGYIFPVKVEPGEATQITFDITYSAMF